LRVQPLQRRQVLLQRAVLPHNVRDFRFCCLGNYVVRREEGGMDVNGRRAWGKKPAELSSGAHRGGGTYPCCPRLRTVPQMHPAAP
jgi:hypothetical protein